MPRIRIVAPSSPCKPDALVRGASLLSERGFDVVEGDVLMGWHAYLNGDDDSRRATLEAALASDVDVVWLARGGYGLTRIIDDLVIPARVPLVVGFSDSTALFARLAVAGLLHRCVHGPLVTTLAAEPAESIDRAVAIVAARSGSFSSSSSSPPTLPPLAVLRGTSGEVTGPLWAGNLVVLAALCGTSSLPSLAGHIVVVEEVGERPYRLDRILTQLLRSGALDDVAAIVVGHLTSCDEPSSAAPLAPAFTGSEPRRDQPPRGIDVVVERLASLGVPIVAGLPCGHEAPNFALPLGGMARLVVDGERAALVADG